MASESLTNTNISDTYVGVLHAKGEALPASGLQDVYDGFGNKSSLKIGRDGEGIDVSGDIGANLVSSIVDSLYPVGSVIFSTDNNNPGSRFTGTGWEQISEGKFVAGVGEGTDKNAETHTVTAGDDTTVGEYNHTLTESEMPEHRHLGGAADRGPSIFAFGSQVLATATPSSIDTTSRNGDTVGFTNNIGGDDAHNNLPPAFGLYVWKRTA